MQYLDLSKHCDQLKMEHWNARQYWNSRDADAVAAVNKLAQIASKHMEPKALYDLIAPVLDENGNSIYEAALAITGTSPRDIEAFYSYESNRGLMEFSDGKKMLSLLEGMVFGELKTARIGCYEKTLHAEIPDTPQWREYQEKLYASMMERLGIVPIHA